MDSYELLKSKYTGLVAEEYEDKREQHDAWNKENKIVEEYIKYLDENYDIDSVIDVPVGTGRFIPLYDRFLINVMGFDASLDMLSQTKRKKAVNIDVSLDQGDIFELSKRELNPDLIVCTRFSNWVDIDGLGNIFNEFKNLSPDFVIIDIGTMMDNNENIGDGNNADNMTRMKGTIDEGKNLAKRSVWTISEEGINSFVYKAIRYMSSQNSDPKLYKHTYSEITELIECSCFDIIERKALYEDKEPGVYDRRYVYLLQNNESY